MFPINFYTVFTTIYNGQGNRKEVGRMAALFQDRLVRELEAKFSERGFIKTNTARILSVMEEKGYRGQPLVYPNESIFALNLNNARPLFFVFVKKEERGDSVTVLASNPREDSSGSGLSRERQYFRRTYSSGTPEKVAQAVISEISELAQHKKLHRMQAHFHARQMLDGTVAFDDGYSNMADIIRRAILHHVDVFAYTPHNSFAIGNYQWTEFVLREFGMAAPLSSEMTMPILPDHPNGPHHIVMAAGKRAADEIRMKIFNRRERSLMMPSYFLGMTMDQMYSVLSPLQKAHQVIVGAAHPVNHSERSIPVNGIGLFSAVQSGHLTYELALDHAKRLDFMECWNDSIYMGEMSFPSKEFKSRMRNLQLYHSARLGIPDDLRLSANLCNLLVAAELEAKFGLGISYGTDAHTEASLDRSYSVGGDHFSRGWTTIEVPEARLLEERRISAGEFVSGVSKKEMKMGAVMFTEVSDGLIHMVGERTSRPPELDGEISKQSRNQYARYVHDLVSDFFGFLGNGKFKDIGAMSK
jgi:hypothetical protein